MTIDDSFVNGTTCETSQAPQTVKSIDAEVARLGKMALSHAKNDQPFADEVFTSFMAASAQTGKRPVLLVDNLQLVFERLSDAQQHSLREVLMRPGTPILLGASPSPPPTTQDYGAAFYDHFKTHYLRPLSEAEMRELLLHLAEAAQRSDVRQRVMEHPQRLKVLRQLTGGNPRTTVTLFFLYAEDFAPNVFGDLEGLLDRVTPLYKARFEELTEQQQVIVSAVASHWDPITSAILAEKSALPSSTISSQIDRLEKSGVLERVNLFGTSSAGFQIAERFFNVWFLFRSASRRQRREIEFLTRFLETFYEAPARRKLAQVLMDEQRMSPDRYLWSRAVAKSLGNKELGEDLERHAELLALRNDEIEARRRMREVLDFDSLPVATLEFDDLRKKLMAMVPDDAAVSPEEFARQVLGSRSMLISEERNKLAARKGKISEDDMKAVLDSVESSRIRDVAVYGEEAVQQFARRCANGLIRKKGDVEDWERAIMQASNKQLVQLLLDGLDQQTGGQLGELCVNHIRTQLCPVENGSAKEWNSWGGDLLFSLSRADEAIAALKEAIALDSSYSIPWIHLHFAYKQRGDFSTAEDCCRQAIATDSAEADNWAWLGELLFDKLDRPEEAEAALLRAVELDSSNARYWSNLIRVYAKLQRFDDAERACTKRSELDKENTWWWTYLGSVYEDLRRFDDAKRVLIQATEISPEFSDAWITLGELLESKFRDYQSAAESYRKCNSLKRDAFIHLGNVCTDFLGEFEEAKENFNKALESYTPDVIEVPLQNMISLVRDFQGNYEAAQRYIQRLAEFPDLKGADLFQLHLAVNAAYQKNWGLATDFLGKALDLIPNGIPNITTIGWLRTTAVLLHLNYGTDLLEFLEERGETSRLRPWVEAIRAVLTEDKLALLNVAPEVRTAAEEFYDGITQRLKWLPDATRRRPPPPLAKKKAGKGRARSK